MQFKEVRWGNQRNDPGLHTPALCLLSQNLPLGVPRGQPPKQAPLQVLGTGTPDDGPGSHVLPCLAQPRMHSSVGEEGEQGPRLFESSSESLPPSGPASGLTSCFLPCQTPTPPPLQAPTQPGLTPAGVPTPTFPLTSTQTHPAASFRAFSSVTPDDTPIPDPGLHWVKWVAAPSLRGSPAQYMWPV